MKIISGLLLLLIIGCTDNKPNADNRTLDFGSFTIVTPSGCTKLKAQGTDSYVGRLAIDNYEHLSSLKIPLHPFLGSIGVAPPGTDNITSGGFGSWGGNLDFRAITKSATLYLPVYHEGALLYLGDGHAAQGDGELNGDALETSLSFAFTVKVIKNKANQLTHPRVEDNNNIMAFGQAKDLDEALRQATLNLISLLQQDYNLSIEEASQLVGPAVEYRIPKIASDIVEVVATINKSIIQELTTKTPKVK